MMNPCVQKEPKVIDEALLNKCVYEQAPKGEPGRLARLEGIALKDVEQIRLEFMNILRIDHLWVLTSLRRLSLNNNLLEKVEHLDSLIHLEELDLSFNKITKIENLDKLTKLIKLSFFYNEISVMENMDSLNKLEILSIGKNCISNLDNVLYLRQFSHLKSLNMSDNPCAEEENFRLFIATFLPQLIYYEYRLVSVAERELGGEVFSIKRRTLLEKEDKELSSKRAEELQKAEAELHSSSFVEYLNSRYLFDSLFADDTEGRIILTVEDEASEFYEEYETQFIDMCKQIFEVGQQQHRLRMDDYEQFLTCVKDAKDRNLEDSIKHMEKFIEKKARLFYKTKRMQDMLDEGEITYDIYTDKCETLSIEYEKHLHGVWKALMKLEMDLYEQMEEVNQNFEHSMSELMNVFIEACQASFSVIRSLEGVYSENMSEFALRFQTTAHITEDYVMPALLKTVMCDKDTLINALAASHDLHMQIIDNREDTLVSRARNWLEDIVDNLSKDEIKRNRGKILEINHFLDTQREEFERLNAEYVISTDQDELQY